VIAGPTCSQHRLLSLQWRLQILQRRASWVKKVCVGEGGRKLQFSPRKAANFRQRKLRGLKILILTLIFHRMGNFQPQIWHFRKKIFRQEENFPIGGHIFLLQRWFSSLLFPFRKSQNLEETGPFRSHGICGYYGPNDMGAIDPLSWHRLTA